MTDQDHNQLSDFIRMYEDDRRKHLHKKPREYLVKLAVLCAARAEHERRDKEEYGAKYESTSKELQACNEEHDRHLEMSDKLADEVNRLRNETDRLQTLVSAALDARSKLALLIEALTNAFHADIRLAELGESFSHLSEK